MQAAAQADRRQLRDEHHARRARARAVRRLLPGRRDRRAAARAAAAGSRSSACRTRAIQRSRATSRRSCAPRRRSHRRRAVQRRRDDAGVAARARTRSDRALAGLAAARAARRRCPSSRSRKAPRITASCAAGSRRASKAARARAFYIGVEADDAQVRRVPRTARPRGRRARELARDFQLVTNRPVSFRLYSSSSRRDEPGALVPVGDGRAETIDDGSDLLELPPIVTVLRARGSSEVTVRLAVHITELGALEIACVIATARAGSSRSTCARAAPARRTAAAEAHAKTDEAKARIATAFATGATQTLMRDLETLLDARRDEWSMTDGARAVRRARRGRGRAQEVGRSRAALAEPRRLLAAPRHRRAARCVARARDVGRVQREPRASQERARPARVVDRVAADRRRAREGPARIRSTTASRSCCCRARSRPRSSPRRSRASRRSPRCGARSRAWSDCRSATSSSSATSSRIACDPQGPRGRACTCGRCRASARVCRCTGRSTRSCRRAT